MSETGEIDYEHEQRTLQTLEGNRNPLFCIPDTSREVIGNNWNDMEIRHKGEWQRPWFPYSNADDAIVVRYRPNNTGRWVEYPIETLNGQTYLCIIKHMSNQWASLSKLPAIVGFGGVMFEGQKTEEWNMGTSYFMGQDGAAGYLYDKVRDNCRPAVPVKARFWVEE